MSALLGIDIGTTKVCALAIDAENGKLLAMASQANVAPTYTAQGGVEQDAAETLRITLAVIRQVSEQLAEQNIAPEAIGVTGQMHGVLLLDDNGNPLTNLTNWQDQRGMLTCPETRHSYAAEVAARLGTAALQRTGSSPATGYGGVTLFRLAMEQALPNDAHALTIHDYLVNVLTGHAVTDPSDAASWGIADISENGQWLPGLADSLGIPEHILPEIRTTGSQAGVLDAGIAANLGLPAGIPVAVALGDNQASFLGSVPSFNDSVLFNLGTGGQMSVATRTFSRAAELEIRPLVAGHWLLVGASLCGGRAYQILRNFFVQVGADLFGVTDTDALYQRMNTLAARLGDKAEGVSLQPLFAGTRSTPEARASITGLSEQSFTPAHLVRATITGMVDELMWYYHNALALGATPRIAVGSGNAIRQNELVVREFTHKLTVPFITPERQEEAAIGAALTGGVAAGIFAGWQTACSVLDAGFQSTID